MVDPTRYLPNSYPDWSETSTIDKDVVDALEQALCTALELLHGLSATPNWRSLSPDVYHGLAGIAMLYLHIGNNVQVLFAHTMERSRQGGEKEEQTHPAYKRRKTELCQKQRWHALAEQCIEKALHDCRQGALPDGPTFIMSAVGVWAVACAVLREMNVGDKQMKAQRLVNKIAEQGMQCTKARSKYDEVLYGRAGYLFGALYTNHACRGLADVLVPNEVLGQVIDRMISSGREGYAHGISRAQEEGLAEPPLSYVMSAQSLLLYTQWHESPYLGAAHGLSGILHVLLEATKAGLIDRSNPLLGDVRSSLDYLLGLKMPSGNYCSRVQDPKHARDRLCQWCHGAPGFAMVYCQAHHAFGDDRYKQAALDACDVTWRYGLLRKDPGLCHGAAGNGYAFLCAYTISNHPKHLFRAVQFARHCAEWLEKLALHDPLLQQSSRRTFAEKASLYEGIAGMAYYIADVLIAARTGAAHGMPGFWLPSDWASELRP